MKVSKSTSELSVTTAIYDYMAGVRGSISFVVKIVSKLQKGEETLMQFKPACCR